MLTTKNKNYFIVMWDINGLECIHDGNKAMEVIEAWEKEVVFATLRDSEHSRKIKPTPIPLNLMLLRARLNSQREYEIYSFETTLSSQQVADNFVSNPDVIKKLIRGTGNKIYSDYSKQDA